MKKILSLIIPFLVILIYFVFSSGWYSPSQLVVRGKADIDSTLYILWDSGGGYNGYERKRFSLNTVATNSDQLLDVVIQYLGERNPASLSEEVVCSKISIDHKTVDLSRLHLENNGNYSREGVRLNQNNKKISLTVSPKSVIEIEMLTNNHSGLVELSVGNNINKKDLYIANQEAKTGIFQYWVVGLDSSFNIALDIPRYPIKKFKLLNIDESKNVVFDSVTFKGKTTKQIKVDYQQSPTDATFDFSQIRNKRYFHPVQLGFQVVFAVFTTWIFSVLFSLYRKLGGRRGVFAGKKKIFWFFLGGAAAVYSFWLVVFWPGVMSVDSLKIWRAALLPELFLNDHPLLNVVLYMYLAQFWQNPAVVAIFHVIIMATLGAYIFYSISKQGVPLKLLLPFYCLLIFSIPVGLYNIVLWKDIPFAMLIVFWGYTLADLYRKKREGCYSMSPQYLLSLGLLLLALALTRHNGLVYLVTIPLYFVVFGLIDRKRFALVLVAGSVILGCCTLLLLNSPFVADANYLTVRVSSYLHNMFDTPLSSLAQRTFYNYWGILDINQTNSKWDLWHYYLGDRQAYWFLTHSQWSDVYPYFDGHGTFLSSLREMCMQLYWKTYEKPWVYLSWNPIYILILLPLTILFGKKTPLSAIFSSVLLIQIIALVSVINIMNWRYYYFVCLGGMFLGPLLLLDLKKKS